MRQIFSPGFCAGFIRGTALTYGAGDLVYAFLPLPWWLFWEVVGIALFACLLMVLIERGG